MQAVLRRHRETPLPRALMLFVGNIEAAKVFVRTLPTQLDYNRSWPGTQQQTAPEAHLMREVIEIVARHRPFASIDIHNNTGNNPHYACVNWLDDRHLHLARLFGRTVVYFNRPQGVQSAALAEFCPAVTIECGRVGGLVGVEQAADLGWSALSLSQFPSHPMPEGDLDLLRTFAIVRVHPTQRSPTMVGCRLPPASRPRSSELLRARVWNIVRCLGGPRTRHLEVVAGGDFVIAGRYLDMPGTRSDCRSVRSSHADGGRAGGAPRLPGVSMHRIGRNGTRSPSNPPEQDRRFGNHFWRQGQRTAPSHNPPLATSMRP
jgi:hypothetical protein